MITILNPGIYSTIQDLGRTGFAHIGVPISGVMDSYSAKIGNQILNNNLNDALIEITLGGFKAQFEKETQISITGADFTPMINGEKVIMNSIVNVKKGAVLSFGKRVFGSRTYVAIFGGIQSQEILKSKSLYNGIFLNFRLRKGDVISYKSLDLLDDVKFSKIKIDKDHFCSDIINCSKGSEYYLLSKEQQKKLTNTMFTISNDNNRVGYRLEESLENNLKSILTSGVLPGTVQLTPSGKLIVLMRDCQVTGGYPRVLQVTEEGLNRLAQKTTNDKIKFVLK